MSVQELWTVVGRSRLDIDFNGQLQIDFSKTLRDAGYELDDSEIEVAKRLTTQPVVGPSDQQSMQLMQEIQKQMIVKTMDRRDRLSDKAHKVVEETFDNAAQTYRTITLMNKIMFWTGIGLFVFSALYAVYSQEKVYSLLFGGLGVASFVALFILGPIDKTQKALSNLVQVEIAFMSYFDQMVWWEQYASIPKGVPPVPDPANIEKASLALQERVLAIIQMLQRYVETDETGSKEGAREKVAESASGTSR